jgi:hypothetical protein
MKANKKPLTVAKAIAVVANRVKTLKALHLQEVLADKPTLSKVGLLQLEHRMYEAELILSRLKGRPICA